MILIVLGPPGSGKGTQSRLLRDRLGLPQISTGDILREAVGRKTPLGKKAQRYMNGGRLVPDEVILEIVSDRLDKPDCHGGYILDGFPRTVDQAKALDRLLDTRKERVGAVLNIVVDDHELVLRLSGRRTCSQCQAAYHMIFSPPARDEVCDRCQTRLIQRDDDREETIKKRLAVYKDQTAPVADYYRQQGIRHDVKGTGKMDEIFDQMMRTVEMK